MNQIKPKQSNATHDQQQRFTTNFSLPCAQAGFDKPFINGVNLLGHFEDGIQFLSIYKNSR